MKSALAQRLYENDTKAFIAVEMDEALESLVHAGLTLFERRGIEKGLIPEALEKKAAPLIRGILQSINPKVSANIQRMDERVIWRIYWELRSNSVDTNVSIFELLGQLNNPPYAAFFA